MKKTTMVLTAILTLSILTVALFLIWNFTNPPLPQQKSTANTLPHNLVNTVSHKSQSLPIDDVKNSGTFSNLQAFHSIKLNAMSPDIKLVTGDEYALEYKIHDRESVNTFEISDGVLYFDTGFEFEFDVDYGNFFITITVPTDVSLETVDIKTVAGKIYTDVPVINAASLISTSGKIKIEKSTIKTLNAKSTSNNIDVNGFITDVDIHSTSGDCTVISEQLQGNIKTVSGKIKVETNENAISASSFGKVNYSGNNKGYRYEYNGNAVLNLDSVSGKIIIKSWHEF